MKRRGEWSYGSVSYRMLLTSAPFDIDQTRGSSLYSLTVQCSMQGRQVAFECKMRHFTSRDSMESRGATDLLPPNHMTTAECFDLVIQNWFDRSSYVHCQLHHQGMLKGAMFMFCGGDGRRQIGFQ